MKHTPCFALGVNYWPRRSAMYWWSLYDYCEVQEDFHFLAQTGLRIIRIFLSWEDFQPRPDQISEKSLSNLCTTADLAASYGLKLMPTFFCGHMSGVNWLPSWLLDKASVNERFPIYSGGELVKGTAANFYSDPNLLEAQKLQISSICQTLKGHRALYAYDLGNETSNCRQPSSLHEFFAWLEALSSELRKSDPQTPVTLGMHAKDLEEDRNMHPRIASDCCDFLSMHAYPFYLPWVEDELDPLLPAFIACVTCWLGQKSVFLAEWGAPTLPVIIPLASSSYQASLNCPLWPEEEVENYYRVSLSWLRKAGIKGAMAWCFSDYVPQIWYKPPLDRCSHERHFGLLRHDGSPKKCLAALQAPGELPSQTDFNFEQFFGNYMVDNFYHNPVKNLASMFAEFKAQIKEKSL